MATLNPDTQIAAAKNPDRAFFGDAPELAVMAAAYGENFPHMWLLPQIFDLCEFAGTKKMDEVQALSLARLITQEYGYLKASELLLFFYRFKTARYGRFYGSVDPMVIMNALDEFLKERAHAYDRRETQERQRAMEEHAKDAISADEYCRRRGLPPMSMAELMEYSRKVDIG